MQEGLMEIFFGGKFELEPVLAGSEKAKVTWKQRSWAERFIRGKGKHRKRFAYFLQIDELNYLMVNSKQRSKFGVSKRRSKYIEVNVMAAWNNIYISNQNVTNLKAMSFVLYE